MDPGTTRAGLHTAREVISGRQISYPVPYMLVILCTLCVACLIVALHSNDATQTVARSAFAAAIAVLLIAVVFRPELVRSERPEQTMRLIGIIGDREMDNETRTELARRLLERPRGRLDAGMGDHHE